MLFLLLWASGTAVKIPGPDGKVPVYPALPPKFNASWRMNESTIMMPCDVTGWYNVSQSALYGVVDFDWSNAKNVWSKQTPMDCQERLLEQAVLSKKANPATKVWIYRNLVKALPWFTSVREKITDPQYSGWFLHYKPDPPYHQPHKGNTSYYHDLEQTPAGDCGGIPCGEYLWDHRNQSLRSFLIDEYIGGPAAMGSPHVDGLFIDDFWSNYPFLLPWSNGDCATSKSGGPSEVHGACVADMALSAEDVQEIAQNWLETTHHAFQRIVDLGGYSWQMLQFPDGNSASRVTPRPASFFRSLCARTEEERDEPTMLRFSHDTEGIPWAMQDLAAFLLIRGRYAWLGYSWAGCNVAGYGTLPDFVREDRGVPVDDACRETSPGVFEREWSRASVKLDTNTNTATIVAK